MPDLLAARKEALRFVHAIWKDLNAPHRAMVQIADEQGATLWMLQLARSPEGATRRVSY